MDREVSKKIDYWLYCVNGRAVGEKRRDIHCDSIPIEWIRIHGQSQSHSPVMQTEDIMVLEIPVRELASMAETQDWYKQNIGGFPLESLDKIIRDKHSEEFLRREHPGLQESWEQYQIMLALCADQTFN